MHSVCVCVCVCEREREMLHLIRLSVATNKQRLWSMNEMSVQSICAMILNRGKLRYSEKNLSHVPLGPTEIPHGQAWNRKYASAVIAEDKSVWPLAWPSRYRIQVHAVLGMDASWHAAIERTLLLLCVQRRATLRWKQGCDARFKSQSGEAIWVAYRSKAYCYNRGHQSKLCDNHAKQRYTPVRNRETYSAIHSMLLNLSTSC